MHCHMPDSQFLECLDLDNPTLSRAAELAHGGDAHAAALEAARALFAQPLRHPVSEVEIPDLARIIHQRLPEQVAWLRQLADHHLLPESPPRADHESEQERALFRAAGRNWSRRGEAVHALGRLWRLTGERKYLEAAIGHYRRIFDTCEPLPDGHDVGAFSWHPRSSELSHDVGHIPEKLCHALPYLRADLEPVEALALLKGLVAMADFSFRTSRYDVTHNITLHMLTGPLLVGLLFPALRSAGEWVDWVQQRVEQDFTSRAFATPDGYFGEGFGYQAVNHNLMLICLRYLQAAGREVSPELRRVCEKSFEFSAAITRTDGHMPLFGDCHYHMPHEHYIYHHEMLHLAAAFFRRPDFKAAAGSTYCEDPVEYNVWLMGLDGFRWWDGMQVPPRSRRVMRPRDLRASGFQILAAGTGLAGHFGLLACAATHNHAHSDFGSIDIYGLGRALLTDPAVTTYEENSYRSERAHNAPVPVRRSPMGPRLDRPDHARTLFVIHRPEIQAACMAHDVYETHRIRRTLCLITPIGNGPQRNPSPQQSADKTPGAMSASSADSPPSSTDEAFAFWLVIDRIERSWPYPGAHEPNDFIETYFHFNAPQTQLGCHPDLLTCWSKWDPSTEEILRYNPTDVEFSGQPHAVRLDDYRRAYEQVTSDANLQVTAIVPERPRCVMDMRFFESFTGEYFNRVKRPSVAYRWQGLLPFDAAYVLLPFRGVRDTPYAKVTGHWTQDGTVHATIHLPQGAVTVHATGLTAAEPRPTFTIDLASPCVR